MIDRIRDGIGIKAIRLVGKLDDKSINELCKWSIDKRMLEYIKAAGLNPDNPIEREILM